MFEIPEEVMSNWATRLPALQAKGATDFPKPSMVTIILGSGRGEPLPMAALQWLITKYPSELPVDLGSASCEKLDREITGRGRTSVNSRASCVVATDEALFYVMPQSGVHRRWEWGQIRISKRRSFAAFSGIDVVAAGAEYKISMGAGLAANVDFLFGKLSR
jgi:hypothetical protein